MRLVRIAVIMPVAAGSVEEARFTDTAESLLVNEPSVRWLVVIDDTSEDRNLADALPATEATVVVLRSPLDDSVSDRESRITVGVLEGLKWVVGNTDCDVVMKVDTDALVIAPFAQKLEAAINDASVGLLGSYDVDCNGGRRSFRPLVPAVKRAASVLHPRQLARLGKGREARRYILESRAAGYEWGEHVLGCALAIPRHALDTLDRNGSLDSSLIWVGTTLYDDPVLAILVRRAGFRIAGHVEEGGGFGVAWRGLPDTPERLAERGFSIIHSVKNDERLSESEIRAYFRARRLDAQPTGD